MNLVNVMNQVAERLRTITSLAGRTYAYPKESVMPPAAIVAFPETYTYDETYGRGMDRLTLPVLIVVGKASARAAHGRLGPYVAGAGPSSVKQVLESGTYTAFDVVRVVSVEFDTVTIASTDYLGALFDLDVTGRGA